MGDSLLAGHLWRILAMAGLLVGSGFFSGTETALFNLTAGQLHRLRRRGRGGRTVARLLARPQSTLNLLLLGNMIVNVAFAAFAAGLAFDLRGAGGAAWLVAAVPIVGLLTLILLGEVAPKMLAYTVSQRWALMTARPVVLIGKVLGPLLWLLETLLVTPLVTILAPRPARAPVISADELDALLDLSTKHGLLEDDAHALLHEIVQLSRLRVADVMAPRVDMIAFDIDQPRQHLVDLVKAQRLRRVVVYEGDIDHVLGLVHAKRLLLSPRTPLRQLVAPVPFVPVMADIERVLLQFRTAQQQVAVAVDEYGGTAGLITLEDILEEIVGDIPRGDDRGRGPAVTRLGEREYLVDADLAVHEWADVFHMDLQGGRISTIGGFVTSLLGRIPTVGDTARYRNLQFTVHMMRGRRVGTIRLDLLEETV